MFLTYGYIKGWWSVDPWSVHLEVVQLAQVRIGLCGCLLSSNYCLNVLRLRCLLLNYLWYCSSLYSIFWSQLISLFHDGWFSQLSIFNWHVTHMLFWITLHGRFHLLRFLNLWGIIHHGFSFLLFEVLFHCLIFLWQFLWLIDDLIVHAPGVVSDLALLESLL